MSQKFSREELAQLPFRNEELDTEERAEDLLSRLTLDEKFRLLTSHPRRVIYSTTRIKRLGIPRFGVTDGPLGIAFQSSFKKCTRFPATISLAATWNRELARSFGIAVAREVRSIGKHMILAPGMNIDRTPLNGRTFEYLSEDPYLTKELAIEYVRAVQSLRIGVCLKHFAANNQEADRRSGSSEVNERTLHEIYLRAFEAVVKETDPWSVMACYNKVNGVYGCENKTLLRDILMDKWGFSGFVMSDWWATRNIEDLEGCINAGLSLEMPWPVKYKRKALREALESNKFSLSILDDLIRRYIRVMMLTGAFDDESTLPGGVRNSTEHQQLARKIAEEGMVLLKNDGNVLPLNLDSTDRIAVLGPNLKKKFGKFLYGGSSAVIPPHEITPLEGIKEKCRDRIEISSDPSSADCAIVFAGLNHGRGMDSETSDRKSMNLPEKQIDLINRTAEENPNTVVVLVSGSPLAMDGWLENVPVVLEAWYSGMEGGRAIVNVLFGQVNPSGRLPITFPRKLQDSPAHSTGSKRTYPGDDEKRVFYDEGIFVGYRWFDQKEIEPLFPFGYGLSYTEFELGSARLDHDFVSDPNEFLSLPVDVTNTGEVPGSETVQVYSRDLTSSVERPPKELVGFEKIHLDPSETREVSVRVKIGDLAFYDVSSEDWVVEPGDFELLIGQSSRDIKSRVIFSYS